MKWYLLLLLLPAALPVGCTAPPARSGDFNADDPAAKIYAIIEAGQAKDKNSVKPLVEQLESDDPLVRVMTINALQHITGTRLGYNPYAPAAERKQAIQRWVQAATQQKVEQAEAEPGP